MYTKSFRLKCSVVLFVMFILCSCDCAKRNDHTKFKRKVNSWSDLKTNNLKIRNSTAVDEKRGFFSHGKTRFCFGLVLAYFIFSCMMFTFVLYENETKYWATILVEYVTFISRSYLNFSYSIRQQTERVDNYRCI